MTTRSAADGAHFSRALVRPPGASFASGLTESGLGAPDVALARTQHAAYCAALERCGLALTVLPADDALPDSTFVEDTAVLRADTAILTRPGAAARAGEVARVAPALRKAFAQMRTIDPPGTVDGGDVCQCGDHFLIGLSGRTNAEGARQLAALLLQQGCSADTIDIRGLPGILHLKSALTYLGAGRIAVMAALAAHPALERFQRLLVAPDETYAANCLRLNEHVLIAAGFPHFAADLAALGIATIALDMSEFRKMDGALTCLSLRF